MKYNIQKINKSFILILDSSQYLTIKEQISVKLSLREIEGYILFKVEKEAKTRKEDLKFCYIYENDFFYVWMIKQELFENIQKSYPKATITTYILFYKSLNLGSSWLVFSAFKDKLIINLKVDDAYQSYIAPVSYDEINDENMVDIVLEFIIKITKPILETSNIENIYLDSDLKVFQDIKKDIIIYKSMPLRKLNKGAFKYKNLVASFSKIKNFRLYFLSYMLVFLALVFFSFDFYLQTSNDKINISLKYYNQENKKIVHNIKNTNTKIQKTNQNIDKLKKIISDLDNNKTKNLNLSNKIDEIFNKTYKEKKKIKSIKIQKNEIYVD